MAAIVANPRFALVGDSLTMYGNLDVGLNGVTLTRDAAGVVTVAKSGHGIVGTPICYTFNCSDTSYEARAQVTVIDANNYSYPTGVTGLAGSITGGTLTQTTIQNRFMHAGYWLWLQSRFGGGARFLGNFGQGGDRSDEMTNAVALACGTAAEFVILDGGINDINAYAATGATVISRIQTHVNTILAAGKKCVIVGITPLGSVNATNSKNTETLAANSGLAALANGSTVFFANPHPDLVDTGSTQFTTGQAWSWVTYDGIHWGGRAANIVASKIYAAINSKVTVQNCLPTSSGNLPSIPDYTAISEWGAWSATGGGFNGTGSSGTVPPKTQVFGSGTTTIVNSLVDRGSAPLGWYHQQVITPGGADTVTNYFLTNSGTSLATLGLTSADTVMFALEYSISGAVAGNIAMVNLRLFSTSSGSFGHASAGDAVALSSSAFRDTSLTDVVLLTGELKLNASFTNLLATLEVRFTGAGSPVTLSIGRIVLFKKNP